MRYGLKFAAITTTLCLWTGAALADDTPRVRTIVPEDVTTEQVIKSLDSDEAGAGVEISIAAPITFRLNSARLTPPARLLLDRIAAALNSPDLAGSRYMIEGHTDASGRRGYNQHLSERRAASVFNYLVSRGVDIASLSAIGYGESRILPYHHPLDPLNRRVEVVRLPSSASAGESEPVDDGGGMQGGQPQQGQGQGGQQDQGGQQAYQEQDDEDVDDDEEDFEDDEDFDDEDDEEMGQGGGQGQGGNGQQGQGYGGQSQGGTGPGPYQQANDDGTGGTSPSGQHRADEPIEGEEGAETAAEPSTEQPSSRAMQPATDSE